MVSYLVTALEKPSFAVLSDTFSNIQKKRKTVLPALLATCLMSAQAYALDSGSTGADGALDFTGTPADTVVDFDPATHVPPLDTDGDGIYHFTTITIPADVTIRMRADTAGQLPVHWLATGDVVIEGTIDLSGEKGGTSTSVRSVPGSGGYPGGAVPGFSLDLGMGPGSGGIGDSAGYVDHGCGSTGHGHSYGNAFIMPLMGGSGGSGDSTELGGGAGGGAILIASNTLVSLNGAILAIGGDRNITASGSTCGGGGSGGAIRLLAPTLSGTGVLDVSGGHGRASGGRIRIETLQNNFTGTTIINSTASNIDGELRVVTLVPTPIITPTTQAPTIKVTSVAGNSITGTPRGLFAPVDVTIDTAVDADIVVAGVNIPLGTTVEVTVWNQTTGSTVVTSSPLAGTLESSTATATVLIQAGYSLIYTHVTW